MRLKMAALGLAAIFALGACGGDDGGSSEPLSEAAASSSGSDDAVNSAKDCAALVDAAQPVFTDAFQTLIDDVSGMSVEDLANMANDPDTTKIIEDFSAKLEADGAAIEKKANELDCSEDDAQKAMCQAVDAIDSKGNIVAETMLSSMASECA